MGPIGYTLSDLEVGMKVRFKDEWPPGAEWRNNEGHMDHWLGEIVTIAKLVTDGRFFIEEDDRELYSGFNDKWYWRPSIIAEILNESAEFEPEGNDAFLRLIGGGQ